MKEGRNVNTGFAAERCVNVVKDDFFTTKKWFIESDDGFKWNTVGFKTKKDAVAAVEATGWTVKEG